MSYKNTQKLKIFFLLTIILLVTSCTAGGEQFNNDTPAGFWYGLWHGIISFISLIIHLFNETVMVYETNNTGGWYDFGFILGVSSVWGGGCHMSCKSSADKQRDKEWEEIGEKVELKVMHKLKNWAEKEESDDISAEPKEDWDELWPKVEKKLKRKIREWAEKE